MPAGLPVKQNYVTGDVLSATNLNDLASTLNFLDPTAKGDLFPASDGATLTRLAVGANNTVLTADSTTATGLKWAAAAAGGDFVRIAQTVLASNAADVVFSSIPSTYRNLRIVYTARASAAQNTGQLFLRFNGDTGSNYDNVLMNADTVITSNEYLAASGIRIGIIPQANASASLPGSGVVTIPNYVGTTFNKELIANGGFKTSTGTGNVEATLTYGQWRNSAAINAIRIFEGQFGGDLVTGTVITLYGES